MNYKIKNAIKTKDLTTQNGTFAVYSMELEGVEGAVEMLQKPETPAPKVGDDLMGTIEDTQWGKRFKKERMGGGFSGNRNDPRTQEQIIRQNALTNAVNFVSNKAKLMAKDRGKGNEVVKYMSGKQIIQVATLFAQYSNGLITVVNMGDGEIKIERNKEIKPIAETSNGVKETPEEPKPDDLASMPEADAMKEPQEEINIEDIPF